MPIFEYRCQDCSHLAEFIVTASTENHTKSCPKCQGTRLVKVFSVPAKAVVGESFGSCDSCDSPSAPSGGCSFPGGCCPNC
ncbi:MAG: hypothetical protein A2284_17450 [Deltaproteobacteria bacterium RIFOXYA12_FULL_61_11]|nr:MAG: hypothetical protein A2284_17450 [Deltaproteobacteria bacterium RIFOXYA12_FULL_61_11]